MSEDHPPERAFPSIQKFCTAIPLYGEYRLNDDEDGELFDFMTDGLSMDMFCVDCEQPSVFLGSEIERSVKDSINCGAMNRVFTREFVCSRAPHHTAYFHFRVKNRVLSKIGQSPSMADISESELRPYRKVLSRTEYSELARAVGLVSHGVGIGSFVYLRRIFERLIDEAHVTAKSSPGWDEALFEKSRMEEKIELLKLYLPPFLVERRKMYGILSKGIHSLREEECLEAFPILRVAIEAILDQKVAEKKRKDHADKAKKLLEELQRKHASPPPATK
jgi:hypothetical protein